MGASLDMISFTTGSEKGVITMTEDQEETLSITQWNPWSCPFKPIQVERRRRGTLLWGRCKLADEDKAGSSLFLVKEIAHSLSPIFGLALVALVLIQHGMAEVRTNVFGLAIG